MPYQLDPNNLRLNYGNSDLDIRNNFTATFVWEEPFEFQSHWLEATAGGWSLSGTILLEVGYLIPSSTVRHRLPTYSARVRRSSCELGRDGTLLNPNQTLPGCGSPGNIAAGDAHQCLTRAPLVPSGSETTFGSGRNLFRGPGYLIWNRVL